MNERAERREVEARPRAECEARSSLEARRSIRGVLRLVRPLGVLRAVSVDASIGMSAKEIALRLREVRGQTRAAIGVVIRQRRTQRRRWNAASDPGPATKRHSS